MTHRIEDPTKHTPGPWSVGRRSKKGHYRFIDADDGWLELARVVVRPEGYENDRASGAANARLIAAAPDLLAALKEQVAECTDPGCNLCFEHKAIIARVEG